MLPESLSESLWAVDAYLLDNSFGDSDEMCFKTETEKPGHGPKC